MKRKSMWKRILTILAVGIMLLAVLPAAEALEDDWDQMMIFLSWKDENGDEDQAMAMPVYDNEGSFWALVPAAAINGLTFNAMHPAHPEWEFDPECGTVLDDVVDAGDVLNEDTAYLLLEAVDKETSEEFRLYISTVTSWPRMEQGEAGDGSEFRMTEETRSDTESFDESESFDEDNPEQYDGYDFISEQEPENEQEQEWKPEQEEERQADTEPENDDNPAEEFWQEIGRENSAEAENRTDDYTENKPEQEVEPVYTRAPMEDLTIPVGIMLNRFGQTTKKVNFRSEMSKSNETKIGSLEKGQIVYLIQNIEKDGEEWTWVLVDGREGYIMTEFLEMMPSRDNERLSQIYGPMPEYTETPEPAAEPPATPEPETFQLDEEEHGQSDASDKENLFELIAEPEQVPEPTPFYTPVPDEDLSIPMGEMLNRFGQTTKKVNFRSEMSKSNETKIGSLDKGQIVYLIQSTEKNGDAWTRVLVDGREGYVMTEFLELMPSWVNEKLMQQYGPMPEYTETPAPTEEPVTPEPKPEETQETEIWEEERNGTRQDPEDGQDFWQETNQDPEDTEEEVWQETSNQNSEQEAFNEQETAETADTIAPGTFINQYGVANLNVNVRSGPGTKTGKVASLKAGDPVYMVQQEENDAGEKWTRVLLNGKQCYVKSQYLDLISPELSEQIAAEQQEKPPVFTATPVPEKNETAKPTEIPTDMPTDVPTITPTPVPTATPSPEPTDTPTPEPVVPGEILNRYAVTTKKNVNFRTKPGADAKRIKQLKKGQHVYMILEERNEQGEEWTYVLVDGKTGYIQSIYLQPLSFGDSAEYNMIQGTPAPVFTEDDLYTRIPPQPTLEETDEPPVEETPTPTPTAVPTPTPTPVPTATATPAEEQLFVDVMEDEDHKRPVDSEDEQLSEEQTEETIYTEISAHTENSEPENEDYTDQAPVITETPGTTEEPVQRIGYAITIGDGAYVRNWPSSTSVIIDELPVNKVVYVSGQDYVDGVAWHVAQYDGTWGYIRADMLRMMNNAEVTIYLDNLDAVFETQPEITLSPYNMEAKSCYGYVKADSVNFRKEASTKSERISRLKKYALCIVYGSVTVDDTLWYKVGYNNVIGYVNGDYFQQMTVSEAEAFFKSPEYLEGIRSNAEETGATAAPQSQATATPAQLPSAEDWKVETWTNPDSTIQVSYKPFDPFATPEPLPENDVRNTEYLDSLVQRMLAGRLTDEELEKTLQIAYQDSSNRDELIAEAAKYVREKVGETATAAPSPTPEETPLATEESIPYAQEQNQGGSAVGWIVGILLIAGAAGGGYAYYVSKQKKRQAAQRLAQKKSAQQRKQQAAGKPAAEPRNPGQPVSAQQAAKVRTGTYTGKNGKPAPKPYSTGSGPSQNSPKPYAKTVENPYARYTTSGGEKDATYTASFRPEEKKNVSGSRRRRNDGNTTGSGADEE